MSIYLAVSNPNLKARAIALWEFIAGFVGLIVTGLVYFAVQDARSNPEYFGMGLLLNLIYGYWGTLAGFIAVIVGAILDLKESGGRRWQR
jgi:hypothetical protein